ncbi:PIN domain-containing protein [Butyrivibrio fibrisolvens]|uniref:PIN domain-containing protein n=1 Tax=Butyrivibrio fibrisolvens TaxID=831 RepID=UPI0003B6F569|nr:PIN domain-containing protein [Butyrivibrio fibrisolvens]
MATILVDYENISGTSGLKGVEYLNNDDYLEIFYGNSANVAAQYMDHIKESGCNFDIHKLQIPRKNALDFYIATETGRLAAEGHTKIVIITRDKGFKSIYDYFKSCEALKGSKLVVCGDIEHGLEMVADPGDVRADRIRKKLNTVNFEVEHARMMERDAIRRKITEALEDTEFKCDTDKIIDFYASNKSEESKKLYTRALHSFGLKNGVAIYRILRDVV